MINKCILVFPCGTTRTFKNKDGWNGYLKGIKVKGKRPIEAIVEVSNFNIEDLDNIQTSIRYVVHPVIGKVSINGEGIDTWIKNNPV